MGLKLDLILYCCFENDLFLIFDLDVGLDLCIGLIFDLGLILHLGLGYVLGVDVGLNWFQVGINYEND